MWIVYLIWDVVGDACYVGKTNDMKKRWREHVNAAKRGRHTLLARALAKAMKHNEARFDYSVLSEHISEEEAFAVERFWIEKFELNALRHSGGCGLNMTDGGEGRSGYTMPGSSRTKISNSLKNHPVSSEVRAILRAKQLGTARHFTEEHCTNLKANVHNRRIDDVSLHEIKVERSKGTSTRDLAIRFGVTERTIRRRLKEG